jgi:hypothetical protein
MHALRDIRRCVAENNFTIADLAHHSNTSEASAWRALNTEPPRWTKSFIKIQEFVKEQSANSPSIPPGLVAAVNEASKGKRNATARLLRALADMLEEGVI